MSTKILIERLATSVGKIREQVDVVGLQQFSLDDVETRSARFLTQVAAKEQRALDRRDWQARGDHSVLLLSGGARAVMYHASGAMKYASGLTPMQSLFEDVPAKERLVSIVEETSKKLALFDWAGPQGKLMFEKLWQMKAQGADRGGKLSNPVLCRAVGAYRHFIDDLPVLGAASAAVKLAGNGVLDSVTVQVRPSASTLVEKAARILPPELAAQQVTTQLSALLQVPVDSLPTDIIESQSMRFGYVDLGKRKAQRVLAPAFVAQVILKHKEERQAYMFAVSATEKGYLPLCQCGHEALPTTGRAVTGIRPVTR